MDMSGEQLFLPAAHSPLTVFLVGLIYGALVLGGTIAASVLILQTLRKPVCWNARIEWLCTRPWTWRDGGMLLGIVSLLIGLGWGMAALLDNPREGTLLIIQGLTLDLAGLLGIAWLVARHAGRWRASFGIGPLSLKWIQYGVLFYIVLIPFILITSLLSQGILSANGHPPELQDIAILLSGDFPGWMRWLLFIFAIGVAPAFEECLFRGILLPMAVRHLGLGAGIFLTSLIFAAIHMHLASFAPLLIIASGLSLAYLYTQSLWVPIIMHGLFNGVNLGILVVMRQ